MKVNVNFDFLGTRNYIHSTSWVYTLINILKTNGFIKSDDEINKFSAVFRSKQNKQGYYLIDEECTNADTIFKIIVGDKTIKAYYLEDSEAVSNSIPYDEDGIVKESIINKEESSSSMIIESVDNIYNVIVSLNKKLLLNILPKENYTSWSVGKFNINWKELYNNSVGKKIILKLINNIDNMYCKSNVYIDDKLVGSIDYARNLAK